MWDRSMRVFGYLCDVNLKSFVCNINMWSRIKERIKRLNPFVAMFALFCVVMLLPIKEFNLWNQLRYRMQASRQALEIKELRKKIEQSNSELLELQNEMDLLEKFARERYLMKAEDEDLYLLK